MRHGPARHHRRAFLATARERRWIALDQLLGEATSPSVDVARAATGRRVRFQAYLA